MKRRNFLKHAGLLPLAVMGNNLAARARSHPSLSKLNFSTEDRVFVLIQMFGGNDGLNTLFPLSSYDSLLSVRENLLAPENRLLPLQENLAIHPAMEGMKNMFAEGLLSVIQSVGYPNPNRSHFRSSDIWATGSASDVELETGWLGRYLAMSAEDYPDGYPNSENPDPLAITFSSVAHPTCEGPIVNYCQTLDSTNGFTTLQENGGNIPEDSYYGEHMDFLLDTIEQTNAYGNRIANASDLGDNLVEYPNSKLGRELRDVARLIHGGLSTKIYVLRMDGFDTHAHQVGGDGSEGFHANLLQQLSEAVTAFQNDLFNLNLEDRVIGMTYSEFGRRIKANASRGTDHGDAGPMFLFGNCTLGAVFGDDVTIDPEVSISAGVDMQYDYRNVFGSVLIDWLGAKDQEIRQILFPDFEYLPILSACASTLPTLIENFRASAWQKAIRLEWQYFSDEPHDVFRISRSTDGQNFEVLLSRTVDPNNRSYSVPDENVDPGVLYYYQLQVIDLAGNVSTTRIASAMVTPDLVNDWTVSIPSPNPCKEWTDFVVDAPGDGTVRITCYSFNGKTVAEVSTAVAAGPGHRVTLPTKALASGMYSVKVSTGPRKIHSFKLVVEK